MLHFSCYLSAMKQKPKTPKVSPTQVAAIAGCSRPLADRLLRRGLSAAEIVERIQLKKRQKAALASANGQTNGHAAAIPPFAISQAKKEAALAGLRSVELAEKTGELMPVKQAQQWITHLVVPLVQGFRALPAEMRDYCRRG